MDDTIWPSPSYTYSYKTLYMMFQTEVFEIWPSVTASWLLFFSLTFEYPVSLLEKRQFLSGEL